MVILRRILNSFIFWGAWILIPFIMEIIPALGSFILLLRRKLRRTKAIKNVAFYPEISIIVPVYNSQDTLFNCIKSIADSTYPTDKVYVFLVNNQGQDNSFSVYAKCQEAFPDMHMQWLNAKQGKSRALNLALYNSNGKYIINIDSDGVLEPHALANMITRFESNTTLNCMTGAILTTPEMIKQHKSFWGRLLRNLEFMEYAQAFLAGRSYASEINSVYTLSGAFSAFRKSAILKSRLYNTDTICEDTQITFQMRQLYKERVEVCENAIFLVDPIESVNKLYTQRQRWQRGSLEVAKMFMDKNFRVTSMFTNVNVKTLLYDHTFAFPRMIWYLALFFLLFMNYSGTEVLYSTLMIFGMYIIIGYFYFFTASSYLRETPDLRKYYVHHWLLIAVLPFFNLAVFFIRIAGIINSVGTDSAWKTNSLTDEKNKFTEAIKGEFSIPGKILGKAGNWINGSKSVDQSAFSENISDSSVKVSNITYRKSIFWYIWTSLIIAISMAVIATVRWVGKTYGVSFGEILSTMTGNIKGTGTDVIVAVIKGCALPAIITLFALIIYAIIDININKKRNIKIAGIMHAIITGVCILLPVFAILFANSRYALLDFYEAKQSQSKIYENYYVDPATVSITAEGQKRNLIFIYLESMETTYSDTANGGAQKENLLPNLTELAYDNVSFSNTDKLGGFHTMEGFGFTASAIFSTTSGLPYKSVIEDTDIYGNVTSLGDILEENGYNQEFLCGSDASFGGRRTYFQSHGNYSIFDLFTAREKGYIPDDYFVWWGFEDYRLFDIAKDEATRMASEDEPFNLTLLTVDTHHISGYVCEKCDDKYDVDTANVVACTDKLVGDFIEWGKQQDFYENTTIVIVGDHPRMDTYLVDGITYYDRTEYNCFINSAASVDSLNLTDREFTAWDIFPTTLAALGYTIDGDKLGLGTNLFSDEKTLAETKGFEWVQTEAGKDSDYYNKTFITN